MKLARSTILVIALLATIAVGLVLHKESLRGKLFTPSSLTVWVFDVGQGDAIFVDGPERQVLIDGGPDFSVLEKLSSVMLPWDRMIDDVIMTHPHADHFVGLIPVLERYDVGRVIDSGQGYGGGAFDRFVELAPDRQSIKAGDVIDLGGGATLTALWPSESYNGTTLDDPNDGSVVLLLEYGETTMLLTGDAGIAQEALFRTPPYQPAFAELRPVPRSSASPSEEGGGDRGGLRSGVSQHIDVLKVGHHGSRTSSSQELIDATTPDIAIVSVAAENDYGLPDEDALRRYVKAGSIIYRTDMHGDIRVTSTGAEPSVQLFNL